MKRTDKQSLTVGGVPNLDGLTEVTQSGWTLDFCLNNEQAAAWNNGSNLVCDGWRDDQNLYDALTALVATWQRTETEDGGVITYTKAVIP